MNKHRIIIFVSLLCHANYSFNAKKKKRMPSGNRNALLSSAGSDNLKILGKKAAKDLSNASEFASEQLEILAGRLKEREASDDHKKEELFARSTFTIKSTLEAVENLHEYFKERK